MKKIIFLLLFFSISIISCKKYLDINSDPDTPQNPDPTSVLPVILSSIPGGGGERGSGGVQFDGLWIGSYVQFWHARNTGDNNNDWDRHGYNGLTGDRAGGIWRLLYFGAGKNMKYCIEEGIKKGQWDVVGTTLAIQAYLFQITTNYHGEIIFKDAFKEDSVFFKYDDQPTLYQGIDSICRSAIDYLNRVDYDASSLRLSRGDLVYNGDVTKWKKFAYGVLARNFAALINKPTYSADSVIKYTDLAMTSGADDCLIPFDGTRNADANIFGTFRDNLGALRQSDYIVRLLDGRVFTGFNNIPSNRDPRTRHMLVASADTTNGNGGYRGALPGIGDPNNSGSTRIRVPVPWGDSINANPGSGNFSAPAGKYLFQNKAVFPIMSYSEMQFMKAEAALRKGDRLTAYNAYRNGINGHFDFINRAIYPRSNNILYNLTPLTALERANYLSGANVKQSAAALTLGDIMQQKFIALWGWGFVETWTDMRKYHYIDQDPTNLGQQVYSGMVMPTALFSENGTNGTPNTKYAYRVRYRYNSEYVWNIYVPAIARTPDYHTLQMWFSQP
ncbi:MAG: SusD/RagB family nutrient-binding outer membrane lipoprotein [Chitinophagaceae bacterium]